MGCVLFFFPLKRLEEIMKRTRKTDTPEKVAFWLRSTFLQEVAIGSKSQNVIHFPLPFPPAQKDIKSSPPLQVNGGSPRPESESNKGTRIKCLLNKNVIIALWKKFKLLTLYLEVSFSLQ